MSREKLNLRLSGVGVAPCALCVAAGAAAAALLNNVAPAVVGLVAGIYLLFAVKVADQWEKVAILRLGRFIGLRGPGIFLILPVIDRLSRYEDARAPESDE